MAEITVCPRCEKVVRLGYWHGCLKDEPPTWSEYLRATDPAALAAWLRCNAPGCDSPEDHAAHTDGNGDLQGNGGSVDG